MIHRPAKSGMNKLANDGPVPSGSGGSKSFLVLFFKKELLASYDGPA
jgi:hypothetical protein